MFFQLMLYDFIKNLTPKRLAKLIVFLIFLAYYTAYNLIERRHPGIHKAQLMVMYNKYVALLRPYEIPFLVVCVAVIILLFSYMVYCYWNDKKIEAQPATLAPLEEKVGHSDTGKQAELAFLKEQIQLIQQRIEAIERG